MTVFVPNTGNQQLNLVLEELANNVVTDVMATGNAVYVDADNSIRAPGGAIVGYVNKYIWVTFADDVYGSNASSQPTNKTYYGILNTNDGANTPTNFLNFSYTATTGFGTVDKLFYRTTGGRSIDWDINAAAQSSGWRQVNSNNAYAVIDLDILTEAGAAGANGANGYSTAVITVFQANANTPVTPSGGSYTFTATPTLITPTNWLANLPANVANTNVSVWGSQYTFVSNVPNAVVTAGAWSTPVVVYRAPRDGADAQSVYQFPVYTVNNTTPGTPVTNTGYYNFGTGTAGAPTGSPSTEIWTIQPSGNANLWVSYSTATANSGGNANMLMWSTPVPLAQTGAAGQNGLSIYNYPVYYSGATAPATPTGGSYDFGTRTGTPPSGWTNEPGAAPVWVSQAQAQIQGTTGIWTAGAGAWSTPAQFTGESGRSTVIPLVFQANASVPPNITTLGYYNFATNTLTPPTGWTANLPAGSGLPIWSSQASFVSASPTANIANTTAWTAPVIAFQSGNAGPAGTRGFIPLAFVLTATDPTAYTDLQFTAAFSASRTNTNPPVGTGYAPIAGDTASFFWNNPNPLQADVRVVRTYTGTNWVAATGQVLDGDLIVPGTVTASQLNTNSLYALNIQSTNANFANFQGSGYWLEAATGNAYFAGGVRIGNGLVIGDGVTIGNNLTVGANANIGGNAIIGNNLLIGNNTIIGNNLAIGANLLVGANAVIGANLSVGSSAQIGANLSVVGLVTAGALNSNVVFTDNIVSQGVTNSVTVRDDPEVNLVGFVTNSNWPNNTRGIGISGGATITPQSTGGRIEIAFSAYAYSLANANASATTQANQANSGIIEIWRSGSSEFYPNTVVGLETIYANTGSGTTADFVGTAAVISSTVGNSFMLGSLDQGSTWSTAGNLTSTGKPFSSDFVGSGFGTFRTSATVWNSAVLSATSNGWSWQSGVGYRGQNGSYNNYGIVDASGSSVSGTPWHIRVGAGGSIVRFNSSTVTVDTVAGGPLNDFYSVGLNRKWADRSTSTSTLAVACGAAGIIVNAYVPTTFNSTAITWVTRTSGTMENLNRVRCNWTQTADQNNSLGTLWVAVGNKGTIVTSADGSNWTLRTSGTTQDLHNITYGNGIWLVVGNAGTVLTSSDGTTWTASTVDTGTTPAINLLSCTYQAVNNYWFIGGQGEFIARSTATASPTWTTVRAAQSGANFNLTRLWYAGSSANVFQTGTLPAQQQLQRGTVISTVITDTDYQQGVPITYYVIIGNNSGDADVSVYTGGPTMTVTEIKR